nr:hypothetical protein [Stenotrophomonas sp. 9(2022)]
MADLEKYDPVSVRWLSFRLRNGQSIGPEKLKAVWSDAAEMNTCSVRREHGPDGHVVYVLYAPRGLPMPRRAEMRLRSMLEDAGYAFTMGAIAGRHPVGG